MKTITYKGKEITMNNFPVSVPFQSLEPAMGKRNTKAFYKWIGGQTMSEYGVYPGDLERWLNNLPIID